MAYITQADVQAKLPPKFFVQALDDDLDGNADAGLFDLIEGQAQRSIDSRLGQRYAVPFPDPVPALVAEAALIFTLEGIYARRVAPDQNPWMGMGNAMRSKLDAIGQGTQPLTPELQRRNPSVSVISSPSKTHSHRTAV